LRSDSVIKITDASVNVSCMQNCPKLFIITSLLSLFKSNTILAQPSTKKKMKKFKKPKEGDYSENRIFSPFS